MLITMARAQKFTKSTMTEKFMLMKKITHTKVNTTMRKFIPNNVPL
jgi:hypothetical protein